MKIFIDDVREVPDPSWILAETSEEAIAFLTHAKAFAKVVEVVSFDHDLGLLENGTDDTTRRVALWMIANNVWPEQIKLHTMNVVGREWLQGTFNRYAPDSVELEWNN